MRYFITAIESNTGIEHQEEVRKEDVDKVVSELQTQGYLDIRVNEGWSDLNEMYETLEKEGLYNA